ncbi:MAG: hypothetical protein V1743_06930 [Nanoarchaeota archaeon]
MAHIETGVDKLVNLVQKRKRISVDDAAKESGMNNVVIEEWADFLEEEGIISIEYSLSKVFLCEKKLSKKEIEKKTQDYEDKKDAFVRKVETAIARLDAETEVFEKIKMEFLKLKSGLGDEMNKIQGQLTEIRHFEDLKKNMDQEIAQQRDTFNRIISETAERIHGEQKKYDEIIATIDKERVSLDKEKSDLKSLEHEEQALKEKLEALAKVIEAIDKRIDEEKNTIENSERKIETLAKTTEKVEEEIKKRKSDIIMPLIEMTEGSKEKILKAQDEIIEKIKERKKFIEAFSQQGQELSKRFAQFFAKKGEIDKLFNAIEAGKEELKKNMDDLIESAKTFNITSSSAEVKKHVTELLKKYNDVEGKKQAVKDNLAKLVNILKE